MGQERVKKYCRKNDGIDWEQSKGYFQLMIRLAFRAQVLGRSGFNGYTHRGNFNLQLLQSQPCRIFCYHTTKIVEEEENRSPEVHQKDKSDGGFFSFWIENIRLPQKVSTAGLQYPRAHLLPLALEQCMPGAGLMHRCAAP